MPPDGSSSNSDESATTDPKSRSLVDAFRRGDPATVEEVRQRVEKIVAFSRYRIPRDDQAGLQQEVLVQIWRGVNRDGFDRDRGFWGFVQTVAARRCIDWLRRYTPTVVDAAPLADSRRSPLSRVLDRERRAKVSEALRRLSPACRELIELRVEYGQSYAEIADRLGRSEQALRAQMYRCVCRARELLGGSEADDEAS